MLLQSLSRVVESSLRLRAFMWLLPPSECSSSVLLGVLAPKSQQLSVRHKQSCSPLEEAAERDDGDAVNQEKPE